MAVPIKITLLALTLLLQGYSQESPKQGWQPDSKGDMFGKLMPGSSLGVAPIGPDIHSDTIRLSHNETYALFSCKFQEIIYPSRVYREIKINSVIRGKVDIPINSIIGMRSFRNSCPDDVFELNKDYLMLDVIEHGGNPLIPRRKKCEDYLILPDTPENRQKLMKKYEKKVVIYEPKPAEGKKD